MMNKQIGFFVFVWSNMPSPPPDSIKFYCSTNETLLFYCLNKVRLQSGSREKDINQTVFIVLVLAARANAKSIHINNRPDNRAGQRTYKDNRKIDRHRLQLVRID